MSDIPPLALQIIVADDACMIVAVCCDCRGAVIYSSPDEAVQGAIEHGESFQHANLRLVEVLGPKDAEVERDKLLSAKMRKETGPLN